MGALLGDAFIHLIPGNLRYRRNALCTALCSCTRSRRSWDFAILVRSGLSVRKAGSLGRERVTSALLPITAGGFVYQAGAGLILELQHDRSVRALVVQTTLISLGIGVMGLLTLIE